MPLGIVNRCEFEVEEVNYIGLHLLHHYPFSMIYLLW